jgi:hypothetical protein
MLPEIKIYINMKMQTKHEGSCLITHFLETPTTLHERKSVSVYKELQPSSSLHVRTEEKSLIKLTVLCATSGEWAKPNGQSCGLIQIHLNQPKKNISNRIQTDDEM